jgi:hypothetical protein
MNDLRRLPTFINFSNSSELFLEMGIGTNGLQYEKEIYNNLHKALSSKQLKEKLTSVSKPAGNNCKSADIQITYKEKNINIEVKSKFDDPLGNFSIKHECGTDQFNLSTDVLDYKGVDLLSSIFKEKIGPVDNYIKYIKKQEPTSYNSKINQFPMYASANAVKNANESGFAKKIADYSNRDEIDLTIVENFYNYEKNTYYVQIGGYGLYYLGFNKYKLNVPKLEGRCVIEIRPFTSGVKERINKETNKKIKVYSVGLRATPMLTEVKNKSKYNLEHLNSINELFY